MKKSVHPANNLTNIEERRKAREDAANRAERARLYAAVMASAAHLLPGHKSKPDFVVAEMERKLARAYETEGKLREEVRRLSARIKELEAQGVQHAPR